MNNFTQRILTGIVLITVIVCSVIFSQHSYLLLILFLNLLALREFYGLFQQYSPRRLPGLILSAGLFISALSVIAYQCDWRILLVNILLVFSIYIIELYSNSESPFTRLSFTFLGLLYVTIPCIFLASLAFVPFEQEIYHSHTILGLFFIVWASDSGAYAFGKLLGKHPLFARISPKKTWEGSAGGTFSALLVAFITSRFYSEWSLAQWITIALIVVVIGTYGDFVKSLLKRSLAIKDSGTILPGHGGMLDRFDSVLASVPFVFAYLTLIGNN